MICLKSAASAASAAVDSRLSDWLEEIEARGTVRRDLAGAMGPASKKPLPLQFVSTGRQLASAAPINDNNAQWTDTA